MNKVQQQIKKAKKQGLTPADVWRMREIARVQATKMETEAKEKAFLYMLAIPLNVLFNDYWAKSAKKKAPKFIEEVIKLYEAVQDGQVSDEELAGLLDDLAGVKLDAEWLKKEGDTGGRTQNVCKDNN